MPHADADLIRRTLRGDHVAYAELVRRYQDRLFNSVYRVTGQAEDAEDIVQETFVKAYRALTRYQGSAQFFTWIYRIALNGAISHKRRRRPAVSLDSEPLLSAAEPPDESFGHRPDAAILRQEDEAVLQAGLNQLNPEFRAALVARDIDGLKYEEIAEVLDVPVGTVRSRIHRARLELRAALTRPALKMDQ